MNVNAHAIVKSSNHSLDFFQYMLLKMFTDYGAACNGDLWCLSKWPYTINTLFTIRRDIELYLISNLLWYFQS